jgi:hypothetical protein
MKNDNSQKPTVEKISIWILEAVEKEWRREPDVMKCRPASQVLGPLKTEHGITDGDIDNAIMFMCAPSRQYLTILNRNDGQAIIPSDNGLSILGRIEQHRLEEKEKRKWSRADKIALVSFIFTVFSFFAGYHFGQQTTDKRDADKPTITATNSVSHTSSQKSSNSSIPDIEAQLYRIGKENGVGISIITNTHMISIITSGSDNGIKSLGKAEDSIRKFLGNDFTNYQMMPEIF